MKYKIILYLFLFFVALLPRIYRLDQTTIYPDEITWIVWAKELIFNLKNLNFSYFNHAWWTLAESYAIALPLTLTSGIFTVLLGKGQSSYSLNIFSDITSARLAVATLSSLLIPLFYLTAKRIVSSKTAFIFSLLFAFDPIYLALSRWVMNDALLTLFIFSALIFFVLAEKNWKLVILAGFSLALAALTKPQGIFPFVSWFSLSFLNKIYLRANLRLLSLACILSLLFIWLLWPGMWHQPIFSYIQYFLTQLQLSKTGYTVYYFGQVTNAPNLSFYVFQIFTKLPSAIVLLLVIFPAVYAFSFKKQSIPIFLKTHQIQLAGLFFCFLFFPALSLSTIKLGARYILPLWPWIYLAAAWSTEKLLINTKSRLAYITVFVVLIVSQLAVLINYFPNYYLYYNLFIGGPGKAQQYDLVGHCIGTKKSIEYINQCYPGIKSIAILGCSNVTAPYYYHGTNITTDWQKENIVIIETTFLQLAPSGAAAKFFQNQKPIFEAKENGAILSGVYTKDIPSGKMPFCSK